MIQINNIPALVCTMAWRPPGDQPLSDANMHHWASMSYATEMPRTHRISKHNGRLTFSGVDYDCLIAAKTIYNIIVSYNMDKVTMHI